MATVEGVAIPGIKIEVKRCVGDEVIPEASGFTTEIDADGFNYHLLYIEADDGTGSGQFGPFTPIEVYLEITYPDCPIVVIPCATIKAAYDATNDGKPVINLNVPCPPDIQPGVGCRVTGGTKQYSQKTFPMVNFVTHGGQVGAPVGTSTAFEPDSPCIAGEWEHVRHGDRGTKHNFHARSFDSLMCACFGEGDEPGVVIGEICNPGDRGNGPEPRRAPANKICFSGVGDIATGPGKRDVRTALFRVDIEDRSEPGGPNKDLPADRYRIRIWVLTLAELDALNDENDQLLDFREAIACSPNSTATTDGAPGALGTAVFGQRAPDIDDGGALDNGNQQIHPTIKICETDVL